MDDRIEATEAWAELVDDLRRGRVYSVDGKRGLGFTAEQVSRLNMPVYDVRGLSLETVSVEEIDAATMMPMRERVLFAEGQTRDGVKRPLVAVIPNTSTSPTVRSRQMMSDCGVGQPEVIPTASASGDHLRVVT